MKKKNDIPFLLVSDEKGNIFEVPELQMTGMACGRRMVPSEKDTIPLPFGSNLYMLPGQTAVGFDPKKKEFVELRNYQGQRVFAVAAFMAPAYLQILTALYIEEKKAPRLPLYSYTAAGWKKGEFYAAGMRIDQDERQDLCNVDLDVISKRAKGMMKRYPKNRLVKHLVENCVCRYGCPAARNFAMERWECPIPTSMTCNAACLGCISLQHDGFGFPASHDRIAFVPTPEEIAEFTSAHLEKAQRPVVSFGQGCEGEPLMNWKVLEEAIRLIRKKTSRGIINLNTNASMPEAVDRLFAAGLDSIRVSLCSARKEWYEKYFRPKGYGFEDVVESMRIARRYKRWCSANYFILPGFTDLPSEYEALKGLIKDVWLDMLQTRNLNIDPVWYIRHLGLDKAREMPMGIRAWVTALRKQFPKVRLGYFNPFIQK